jgi:hypothetical protein
LGLDVCVCKGVLGHKPEQGLVAGQVGTVAEVLAPGIAARETIRSVPFIRVRPGSRSSSSG